MYKVVRAPRLHEQIVQQIEDSILAGSLKAGDQLPGERDLAQTFGVNRTAVREAVRTLREKGLVEAHSGRGTFIKSETAHPSLELLSEINSDELAGLGPPVGETEPAKPIR